MDSRHIVFRHLGVSADQYNGAALLAAEYKNVPRVSVATRKEIVFRFRKDIQPEQGWWLIGILCMSSTGMKGICADAQLYSVLIRSVATAWGFSSRRDIVLNLL